MDSVNSQAENAETNVDFPTLDDQFQLNQVEHLGSPILSSSSSPPVSPIPVGGSDSVARQRNIHKMATKGHQRWTSDVESAAIKLDLVETPQMLEPSMTIFETDQQPMLHAHCGCFLDQINAQMRKIEQNGGDFPMRAKNAFRIATGTFLFFVSLVVSDPAYLGAIWIGNIFFHVSIKRNVGESLQSAWGYSTSIVLTTLLSWPIVLLFRSTSTRMAQVLLPPLTFCLSLIIMTCPWITSPNLMILVMFVVVAAPIRFETTWWDPLGNMCSYLIGLSMAVLMNLIPPWQPNTATRQMHDLLNTMSKNFSLLFMEELRYTYTTGRSPKMARAAGAEIKVTVDRIAEAFLEMKRLCPAVATEIWWRSFWDRETRNSAEKLASWILVLETILVDLNMLKSTLNSRFLGETNDNSTISTRYIRRIIADELGEEYRHLVDDLIQWSVTCNQRADPLWNQPNVGDQTEFLRKNRSSPAAFASRIAKTRKAFGSAIRKVTTMVHEANGHSQGHGGTATPVFAHIARRSTSIHSLLSIAEALNKYLEVVQLNDHDNTRDDSERDTMQNNEIGSRVRSCLSTIPMRLETFSNTIGLTHFKAKWLWHDPSKRRLALKTALGMMLASLWMAVPALWNIAQPFGFWPGLTVASVNLASTGSSFHKAIDRLVGTLFAAAYALLVADFFPGNADSAKIPAIAIFTWTVIYLKNDDHEYQYSYAATSIGSMLYGSVKIGYNVEGYIPQRIELIFVGVITFALIELVVFPKSSRLAVETRILEFFFQLQSFVEKANEVISHGEEATSIKDDEKKVNNDNSKDDLLDELTRIGREVSTTSAILKTEVQYALLEPYFGFSHRLHPQAMNGLVSELRDVETKVYLLIKALKYVLSLRKGADRGKLIQQQYLMSTTYSKFLQSVHKQLDESCEDFKKAFPDGRFHPQDGNLVLAITAAASFRDFRDIRFRIISNWSELLQKPIISSATDPEILIVWGMATSFILEICRHLQLAGKKIELATAHFPATR